MCNDLIETRKNALACAREAGVSEPSTQKLQKFYELATEQLRAEIMGQKEAIEMERSTVRSTVVDCWGKIEEQSALIEKLAGALKKSKETLSYGGNYKEKALAAYNKWKGKV